MLNDVDGHGGAGEAVKDAEALLRRLKRDVKADYNSKGQVNWRREAREDFDFEAGEQLNEEDKAILKDAKCPIVIFNRVGATVDSVAGPGSRQLAEGAVLAGPARRREKMNF
jgi:serine/threonine protein phosphatase PrpC